MSVVESSAIPTICSTATWSENATTVAGGNGGGDALNQLDNAADLFLDSRNNNVYVADYSNSRIVEWAPGALAGKIVAGGNGNGSASNQLHHPTAVFVDENNNIYIADDGNDRVQKWAKGAMSGQTVIGQHGVGPGNNQFNKCWGLYVDQRGNIYLSDYNNHRVMKWDVGATTGIVVAGGEVIHNLTVNVVRQ
ncbi:unnamed protein product [Rotaria sp. Silwood1]|nr:unnamed protein product [Rotaria sp. Silwood1]